MTPDSYSHVQEQVAGKPGWRGALLATAIGTVALLVAAEGVLRLGMPNWREFYSGNFMTVVDDPKVGPIAVARKNFDGYFSQNNGDFRVRVRVNDFHLRNDEPVSAAHGRIWVIGDSMAFGWGVDRDKIYTQVIADKTGVPTYNVATPGVGICQWMLMYERMPIAVRPIAVVAGLNIENRMQTHLCPDRGATGTQQARQSTPEATADLLPSWTGIKQWLTQRSALYNFLAVAINRIGWAREALIRVGLVAREHSFSHYLIPPAQAEQAIRATADSLLEMRRRIPPEIPFVVLVNPARFELMTGDDYYRRLRMEEVAALKARGLEVVDVTEDLKAAGFHETHFLHDGHWSPLGHRVAGEALARRLSTMVPAR